MNTEFELHLLQEITELKKKIQLLTRKKVVKLPTYRYSKIRDTDLKTLFKIERNLDEKKFDTWFNTPIVIDQSVIDFLTELLNDNKLLIESYNEEDLKINFLAPLLNKVRFKSIEKNIRHFYELPIIYKTNKFILHGTADFVVAEGLIESKKPYFFIQEFKRSEEYGNPRPQLLAELISAVELNKWITIKGAYIIGGNWHFVIVEKLQLETYKYFISQNFDATKLDDLICIYKYLVCIKHEIFAMIDAENSKNCHS